MAAAAAVAVQVRAASSGVSRQELKEAVDINGVGMEPKEAVVLLLTRQAMLDERHEADGQAAVERREATRKETAAREVAVWEADRGRAEREAVELAVGGTVILLTPPLHPC